MSTLKVNAIQNLSSQNNLGRVLQVVTAEKLDTATTANDGDNPYYFLNATITPASTSSKVVVMCNGHFSSNGNNAGIIYVARGSTVLRRGNAAGVRPRSTSTWMHTGNSWQIFPVHVSLLDAPSTTSATTYYFGVANGWTAGTAYINYSYRDNNATSEDPRVGSSIVLMEVSA